MLPCGASPRATPCPGRSCCSPCALVEPFVTVFSSQPLALPDRTVHSRSLPSPPLVPLPETHSKPLRLLHRSRYYAGTPSPIEHTISILSRNRTISFPKRGTHVRGYLEFRKFLRGSLENERIDYALLLLLCDSAVEASLSERRNRDFSPQLSIVFPPLKELIENPLRSL